MLPRRKLSERTGEDGWNRTDTHGLASHNDGDWLSVLSVQFQFTAEKLRGRNRTGSECHVFHQGAVHEDGLGCRRRVQKILGFHIEAPTVAALPVVGLARGCAGHRLGGEADFSTATLGEGSAS